MRPYLLDFLIEAHTAFGLLNETLFLAVNLLDRYCSKRVVYKRHYQLVGCASLLIAAKYGDRKEKVPTIRDLKSMCCSLYEDDMFIQMEWHVLQTLDWTVGHPTVDGFLQLALDRSDYDPEVEHMAGYLTEISLFHKEFVSTRPSVMARSALALARCILGRPTPREQNDWASSYDSQTIVGLSQQLHRPSPVLLRKYATEHLSRVSSIVEDFLARQASIARRQNPTTPPAESFLAPQTASYNRVAGPQTPIKGQHPNMPNGMDGMMTPPITPEGEYFHQQVRGITPSRCPSTPTPQHITDEQKLYFQNYQPSYPQMS
jgi:Cyclin, N-terminal domain/Cyclin, C-terminal domain